MSPASTSSSAYNLSAMDSSDDKLYTHLPKLQSEGENFVTWKAELRSAITGKGLLRYIDGRASVPVEPSRPAEADPKSKSYDADAAKKFQKEYYSWELACDSHAQHTEKVKTLLYSTIPETLKLTIIGLDSAADAWKAICDEFQDLGDLPQQSLLDRMHALRCDENGDPRTTLDELAKLKAQYADTYAFTVGADFAEVAKVNLPARGFTRILDSGASRHFDPVQTNFSTFRDIPPKPITSADGKRFFATGEGDVPIS
ncbi:hypothetical protein PUNSTDRAFT_16423, partial [Punctularia strigosozonata HHB-11173 SS5]